MKSRNYLIAEAHTHIKRKKKLKKKIQIIHDYLKQCYRIKIMLMDGIFHRKFIFFNCEEIKIKLFQWILNKVNEFGERK